MQYAICFNDFSLLEELNVFIDKKLEGRLSITKNIKDLKNKRLESLERLERLDNLNNLNGLCNLQITNLDYRDVPIEEDSVIYCDPPYLNAKGYEIDFNHNEFYDWCRNQKNVFISEYTMPLDFKLVAERCKFCSFGKENRKVTTEKLFTVNN